MPSTDQHQFACFEKMENEKEERRTSRCPPRTMATDASECDYYQDMPFLERHPLHHILPWYLSIDPGRRRQERGRVSGSHPMSHLPSWSSTRHSQSLDRRLWQPSILMLSVTAATWLSCRLVRTCTVPRYPTTWTSHWYMCCNDSVAFVCHKCDVTGRLLTRSVML